MSAMLDELLRWQRPIRAGMPSDRWTAWAQSRSERYGRLPPRVRGLEMTLVRPAPPLLLRCQRWERVAWTLAPQIRLALSLVFPPDRSRGFEVLRLGSASAAPFPLFLPAGERLSVIAGTASEPRGDARPAAYPTAPERATLPDVQNILRQAPLRYLFARINPSETAAVRSDTRIVPESALIPRRVVEERQRIEEWPQRTLLVRQPRQAAPAKAGPGARQMPSWRGNGAPMEPPGAWPRAYPSEQAPPLPVINTEPLADQVARRIDDRPTSIEQRTDQVMDRADDRPINIERLADQVVRRIDDRLIAYRERMGKLF